MEVQEAENVAEFKQRFYNFVNEFASKSQNHCIVTREKATRILRVLKEDPSVDDPQLKFYVKQKQFQLRHFPQLKLRNVLCVPTSSSRKNSSRANQGMFGKYHRVALKDEFFNIIYEIHTQEGSNKHLGYKSTIQEINRHHAHIPRAVVLNFIKMCPLCSQSLEDLNLLSASDLSQSSTENNDNHIHEDSFVDIKPNLQILSEAVSQFAKGLAQDHLSNYSSSSQPFMTSLQYSPAPPPSATQWSNSLHQTSSVDNTDQEIIDANHFMAVGKVSIIDIQELLNLSTPPRRYTCLVHYIDLWSKYSVLWPLRLRDIDELAFGIAKNVFAYFGSPKQIIYDTNFEEAQQLEESLRKWSNQVKVTTGLQEPLASSGPVHWTIVDKLKELLVESWEVKLSKLQYISNTKLVTTHGHISPYKAVTGNDPMTEAFSELADKYILHPDTLQPDFLSTELHNNIPTETNLDPSNELAGYSLYEDSTPTISNICHINLSNSPVIASSAASGHQIGPTPTATTAACTMDVVSNTTSNRSKQLATAIREQRLPHNTDSVSPSVDQYPSPGSQVHSSDIYLPNVNNVVANNNNHSNHLIYIDDDDDDDNEPDDMKNIPLIEDLASNMPPSVAENHPTTTERGVENDNPKNIAMLEDFSSSVQPLTSQRFATDPVPEVNDSKNILLLEDFNSNEQPSTSQNSETVPTDQPVSVLDKLPRLAQSFSLPSSFDNQEEVRSIPNPTDLESSLASSLADGGLPFLTKSARNVIDKYRLRAKILNSTQMKGTRRGEGRLNSLKQKAHNQQHQQNSSQAISTVPNLQSKQKILYGITSVHTNRSFQSSSSAAHRLKSRSAPVGNSDFEEKRKEYWRRMKQRARARLSQEEREIINKRRRQKYAERKMSFINYSDDNHAVFGGSTVCAPFVMRR